MTEGGAAADVVATLTLTANGVSGTGSLAILFSSRRRHTGCLSDWSSDVCSSDLSGNTANIVVTATDDTLIEATLESFPGQALSASSAATQSPATSGADRKSVV